MHDAELVRDADDMGCADFIRHMNYRHKDSLGGLSFLPYNIGDYVENCYRIFHDRLHSVRVDLEHEHE